MTTATVALLKEPGEDLVLEDVQIDQPGEGEVLVRIKGVGICHTDITAAQGMVPLPLPSVLGHEGSGVIEAVGEGVTNVAPGDHVVLSFDHCGDCQLCQAGRPAYCELFAPLNYFGTRMDGTATMSQHGEEVHGSFFGQSSFGTYALASARNTVKVPSDLPIEILGPLGCGLQTGAGTVMNVLEPRPGDSIAIFGMGGVGLSGVMAAKALDCGVIIAIDLNDDRLELATELGATHTINPSRTKDVEWAVQEAAAPGVHCCLEAVGAQATIALSVKILRSPGITATVGFGGLEHEVTIDQGHLLLGRTLTGVIEGDADPQTFIPQMIELHEQGKFPFEKLIKTFPFAQINEAIAASEAGEVVKPVLVFD
ncbi:MAG TPA: NAD(P)-dependent alcohol dehydrogenase [Baekduia sp.]|nr:NAD(P)-dependent alcohol dehydrogenase [Baekduia sp.]